MYTFSSPELQVLSNAIGGNLAFGSTNYQEALAYYLNTAPLAIVNPEFATSHFNQLILTNVGKPHALFYDLAAEFASLRGTPGDANVIQWLSGAAGVNRGTTQASSWHCQKKTC